MRKPYRFTSFVFALLLMVLLSACQQKVTVTPTGSAMTVEIRDSLCPSMTIRVGDQVNWRNQGTQTHQVQVTANDGSSLFDSGGLASGDSTSYIFLEPGTYDYSCSTQENLGGTIDVLTSLNSAQLASIQDGSCPSYTLPVNSMVMWLNEGVLDHQVLLYAKDGSTLFDSGNLVPKDSKSYTFTQPGTYEYFCSADQSLKGTITIEK